MSNWENIWNNERRVNDTVLQILIEADGFDSGSGKFLASNWRKYSEQLLKRIEFSESDSIFEVCSGGGAFLYGLYENGYKVGGLDYSKVLVTLATKIMPNSKFVFEEAINTPSDEKYDVVMCHSAFQYFKSLDYAEIVLEKMLEKANKKIAVFDINCASKENEYHKIRSVGMSQSEYENKYKGLDHIFYDRTWFQKFAEKNECKIEIFDQDFASYSNASLRFNVIITK